MTLDGKAPTLYERQQNLAEPAYKKLLDLVGSIECGDLDFLHGLQARLEVEMLLGHFHGARKHLYRAAADLCEDAGSRIRRQGCGSIRRRSPRACIYC